MGSDGGEHSYLCVFQRTNISQVGLTPRLEMSPIVTVRSHLDNP